MKVENKQNYLEFMFEEGEKIIAYECEMILNNEIDGLLTATRKSYNGKTCLMYSTREKVALKRLEEGGKISMQDFLSICSSLLEAVCNLKEYSLYSGGVMLDKEFIFVDPRTMRCGMIYLPNADKDKPLEEIQYFFRELFFSGTVKMEDGAAVNWIVEILNQKFPDAGALKKALEKENVEPQKEEHPPKRIEPQRAYVQAVEWPDVAAPEEDGQKANVEPIPKAIALQAGRSRPQSIPGAGKKPAGKKEGQEKTEQKGKDRSGRGMLLITGILVVGIAFLLNNGFFTGDSGQLDTSMLAGICVAALGIEFLAYKKLKGTKEGTVEKTGKKTQKEKKQKKEKIEKKEKPRKAKPPYRTGKGEKRVHEESIEKGERRAEYRIPQAPELVAQAVRNVEPVSRAVPVLDNNMTEYMDDKDPEGIAYLENAMGERYYLTMEHTRIGSLADRAEIVLKSKKVSKLHAEILKKEGRFFLMDLNSTNGTYLNHSLERLVPCMDYELASGYVIRFANEEFVFRMEQ